jgi:hypothetical protein
MALKSPTWFLARAYREERDRTRLCHLSARALRLGLAGVDNTRGHVKQPVGAVQRFFELYPAHLATVKAAPELDPYKPVGPLLNDWIAYLGANTGRLGRRDYGYNYDTLRRLLTAKYGGTRTGGGGGDNEFEIVMRLVAAFM